MDRSTEIQKMLAPLEKDIKWILSSFDLPGMAVGAVKDGEVVYARAFGVKNAQTRQPLTPDSLFHMASISKTYVSTAVVQLVERGKIDLSQPVIAYLPYFKIDDERYSNITVQQMLSHISGMPDVSEYDWDKPEYDDGALERYVRSLSREKLISAPGEQFSYSNMAYEVLGAMIASVSGQTFEDFIAESILIPLGMEHSTFLKQQVFSGLATTPHVNAPQLEVSPVYPYNRAHAPSSTLHSNVLEMGHWMIANLNRGKFRGHEILLPSSYDLLWHPYRQIQARGPDTFVGLSWFIDKYKSRRIISHAGGDVGFNTFHALLPEESLGVVVLANSIPAPVEATAKIMVDYLLGFTPQLPKPPALLLVWRIFQEQGLEAGVNYHHQLESSQPEAYTFSPKQFTDAGELLMEVHKSEQAREMVRLGLGIYPDTDSLYLLLGWIHMKRGETAEALAAIRQCLKLNPENRIAKKLIADLLEH